MHLSVSLHHVGSSMTSTLPLRLSKSGTCHPTSFLADPGSLNTGQHSRKSHSSKRCVNRRRWHYHCACCLQDFHRLLQYQTAVNTIMFLVVVIWMAKHGYGARAMLRQLFLLVIYSLQPLWLAAISTQTAVMQARLSRQGIHVAGKQLLSDD